MKDKETKLKLMRFWLFGTFAIVLAGVSVFMVMWIGYFTFTGWQYWFVIALTALLCYLVYYFYKQYLDKKE